MTSRPPLRPIPARGPQVGLGILYAFTVAALLGYATFGRHPELLARVPGVAGLYGPAFRFFAVGHVWVSGLVLAHFLFGRVGLRWLPALGALYGLSLASELLGTGVGVPFGEYRYSPLLAPMWLGLVPVVIPLSWFCMAIPSFALARAALPGEGRVAGQVLLGSWVLLAWDLALDPAMSHATAYWVWGDTGAYYGMPWSNLLGWYLTGVALMSGLALLRAGEWIDRLPLRWLALYYAANLLLPLGMCAAAGLWGAVAATLGVLGATAWAGTRLQERIPAAPAPLAAGAADPRAVG